MYHKTCPVVRSSARTKLKGAETESKGIGEIERRKDDEILERGVGDSNSVRTSISHAKFQGGEKRGSRVVEGKVPGREVHRTALERERNMVPNHKRGLQ